MISAHNYSGKQNNFGFGIISKLAIAILCVGVLSAICYESYWSLIQTKDFFSFLDTQSSRFLGITFSWFTSIIVQYGQNLSLWFREKARRSMLDIANERKGLGGLEKAVNDYKSEKLRTAAKIAMIIAGSLMAVDAWTNIGQVTTQIGANPVSSSHAFVLYAWAVAVTFVEEAFVIVLAIFLHVTNDIVEMFTRSRIGWMDIEMFSTFRQKGAAVYNSSLQDRVNNYRYREEQLHPIPEEE